MQYAFLVDFQIYVIGIFYVMFHLLPPLLFNLLGLLHYTNFPLGWYFYTAYPVWSKTDLIRDTFGLAVWVY